MRLSHRRTRGPAASAAASSAVPGRKAVISDRLSLARGLHRESAMIKRALFLCALTLSACVADGPDDVGEVDLDLRVEAGAEGAWRLENANFIIRSGTEVVDNFV